MKNSRPVNVRRPEVMGWVQTEVERYQSPLVDEIRRSGGVLEREGLRVRLASAFGFCDGVRRAIEIAYATCRMFPERRIWLIGEIIHNPEVNARLDALGLRHLPWGGESEEYRKLTPEDVVIIPAFGVPVHLRRLLEEKGVALVDSTCGNVMKVWQRVRNYAGRGITSIIHGKVRHEESMATASQSRGEDGKGRFLVIFSEEEARMVADYIEGKGERSAFLKHFAHCCSEGFDPDEHLKEIGMANQTTMLKSETTRIQNLLREAVLRRDGNDSRFHVFDTICGATQDRQNALFELLQHPLDMMFIIGGYNSSNTTHLAQIAESRVPTFFVESAECLESRESIRCYVPALKRVETRSLPDFPEPVWRVGITAGASCPANIIEQVIRRLTELRASSFPLGEAATSSPVREA